MNWQTLDHPMAGKPVAVFLFRRNAQWKNKIRLEN
jgi:hypothetical protein